MKKIAGSLKIALAQYREIASFSQLSSDLDPVTKAQLERGKKIVEILKQERVSPVSIPSQIILFYAVSNSFLDNIAIEDLKIFENRVIELIDGEGDLKDKLVTSNKLTDELITEIEEFIKMVIKDVQG